MQYKFLIYISYSYSVPIGIPLEKEIKSRGYKVNWFSDIEEGKEAISNKTNVIKNVKELIDYRPDIVLAATDLVADFITGLKVQIFHGFNAYKRPEKNNKFAHFRIRGFFDLYCTQGPNTTNRFKKIQKKNNHFEVIETGWSKVDPLFPIKKKSIDDKPTIMIASTFTKRLSLAYNEEVYETIKRIVNNGNYMFIMVLHPKIPVRIVNKWKSLKSNNFNYYDTTDLIPLFKKSDILFSDTTSAIQEFILQKKPVVTYNHTMKFNYLLQISQAKFIEKTFEKALTYPSNLLQNINCYINELHPYNDGKSSQRIIDASIKYLHNNKKNKKNKPINIIRKYKIRKRLKYFTLRSFNKPFTIKTQRKND
ncbi:MAG: CDP-glycerol glycerophosphotransferase [Formosa sp.]|nr:CDP-glycerol glycerophosphotransferase [Formosa sp.]